MPKINTKTSDGVYCISLMHYGGDWWQQMVRYRSYLPLDPCCTVSQTTWYLFEWLGCYKYPLAQLDYDTAWLGHVRFMSKTTIFCPRICSDWPPWLNNTWKIKETDDGKCCISLRKSFLGEITGSDGKMHLSQFTPVTLIRRTMLLYDGLSCYKDSIPQKVCTALWLSHKRLMNKTQP